MAYVRTAYRLTHWSDALLVRFASLSSHYTKLARLSRGVTSSDSNKARKCIASFPLLAACASERVPDVPQLPPIEDATLALNALGEPTFASLGLNSYWPSGWYQAVLEFLHVNLDLPWWAAIATTTVVIRLCLIPFVIDQRRKLAAYTNVMPQINSLQNRMTRARVTSDYVEMMKVSQELQHLMKNNDINPLNSMRLVLIQVPIFLSVFAGLRGMAQLPVESLQTGGLGWFADLTVCDPLYILPLYSMSSIFLMFEFGADMSSQGLTPGVRLAMRVFPVVGFFMIMHMPSALLWYWSISNTISILQALTLRTKSVRTYLKFPEKVEPPPQLKNRKGFVEGFKESMSNSRLLAELEARERTDAERWQKAGMGAVPKTFAYDITTRNKKPIINAKGTVVSEKSRS
ncbi:Mitochondrial inner membrane protein OXA1L [Echinococcus granulosus]|uniref:Cytochrome oxidase biogenesis protein n=1 Tax=Echinococcus granulosus TaxID=6210 RepID=U6J895_ECHGR|nr:Mitochondrial inner membrane protein OXA1L [Echinococcus granulosus]EUB58458.1 Mitochondrial inner membrane protein OXA1L [Echinococcus granulosus]KAH9284103.1 Mitochondrial inner membrane protein OXA1L [Echinococcus granulosus]CDS20302.1 cytochrome oxidase biogenesis protein [Echinococcus granulosus]